MVLGKTPPPQSEPIRTGVPWLDTLLNSGKPMRVQVAALLVALGVPLDRARMCYCTFEDMMLGKEPPKEDVEDLTVDLIAVMRRTPHERLAALTESAIAHKEHVMLFSGDKDKKDKVASEVLDRVMGKPTQTVISHNLNTNMNASNDMKQVETELAAINNKIARIELEREKLKSLPSELIDKPTIDV